jgi:hypothetical protein
MGIRPPDSDENDGCPMLALAYLGGKSDFSNAFILSTHPIRFGGKACVGMKEKRPEGSPIIFSPGTLEETWDTRSWNDGCYES